ncbi:CD4-2 molecule, tandem duplicate 2 [Siniperca chuatsi]|uniref:CD4-2 molecule, tandem duplicate 2 n=1 Tax=Siniperca chuatsi TaxID=119488 RepID=UPI001CE1F5CD|nr:CD4-2 molecule, tandem duplicate 2 [Siniperca chuatsi]
MIKMNTIMWFGFVLSALSAAGKVILTKPGQNVPIECGVSSFTNLEWYHGSNQIININKRDSIPRKGKFDIVSRLRLKQDMDLEIMGVKEEDAGKFTCKADRQSQEHILLVVSVSASPSSDLQLGSKLTLQCQVKGLDQGSTASWKRPDELPPAKSHTESHTVKLKSVALSDAGIWKCTFSHGTEVYSESLEIKVKVPAPTTPAPVTLQVSKNVNEETCPNCGSAVLLGFSWWVWVAIGVCCLVVVLLMVFVLVLCKRIRRRKRKLQKMKYDRQLLMSKQFCQCNCRTAAAKPQQGRRREKPSALPLQP